MYTNMTVLTIVIIILAIGVLMWLINSQIPMDATIKRILNVVVIVFLVGWLLKIFGVWGYLAAVHV